MDFGDQRTSGVDDAQLTLRGPIPFAGRHPVRAENDALPFRDLFERIDKDGALAFEGLEHEAVVHYLMAHIERSSVGAQRAAYRLNGAVHTGAKSARFGQDYFFNRCFAGKHNYSLIYQCWPIGQYRVNETLMSETALDNALSVQFGWMRRLAADPDFAAFEIFFLPHRNDFLEPIDREAARLEGFRAMRSRDRNRHRGFADRNEADAMLDRDAHDFETLARLAHQFSHLTERHRFVGLILQMQYAAPRVAVAGGASKGHRRASRRICDGALQSFDFDWFAANRHWPDPRFG